MSLRGELICDHITEYTVTAARMLLLYGCIVCYIPLVLRSALCYYYRIMFYDMSLLHIMFLSRYWYCVLLGQCNFYKRHKICNVIDN